MTAFLGCQLPTAGQLSSVNTGGNDAAISARVFRSQSGRLTGLLCLFYPETNSIPDRCWSISLEFRTRTTRTRSTGHLQGVLRARNKPLGPPATGIRGLFVPAARSPHRPERVVTLYRLRLNLFRGQTPWGWGGVRLKACRR